MTKPTIAELEAILNCPEPQCIEIMPDGSIVSLPAILEFGAGKFVVTEGSYDSRPAVFITEAKVPGKVGAPADRENNPKDKLSAKERVLLFATEAQAKAVADALCGDYADDKPI